MNDQLDRIERMLRAQLKSTGHIWWIGGYVYGSTSQGDLFVILYAADERLSEKVVRVYPHDFKKLPAFIPTAGIDAGDTDGNPNKEQARKRGIYHDCPLFEVVTFDGRDTQMGKERRFGDVLRVSSQAPKTAVPQQATPARPVPNTTEVREGGGRKVSTCQPAGPLPDDEQVVREAPVRKFISTIAGLLDTDDETIKNRLRALGYKGIPADDGKRLDAYRKLKAHRGGPR